jgi:hypothetical protein
MLNWLMCTWKFVQMALIQIFSIYLEVKVSACESSKFVFEKKNPKILIKNISIT